MVHIPSDKELTVNYIELLEKDAGFNTIDAKLIDFVGALKQAFDHLNISGEDKNSISYTTTDRQPETSTVFGLQEQSQSPSG